jgi:hypothetical protein
VRGGVEGKVSTVEDSEGEVGLGRKRGVKGRGGGNEEEKLCGEVESNNGDDVSGNGQLSRPRGRPLRLEVDCFRLTRL